MSASAWAEPYANFRCNPLPRSQWPLQSGTMQKQVEELRASQAAQKRLAEQLERERQALAAAQREIAALRAGGAHSQVPPGGAPLIGPPMLGAAILGRAILRYSFFHAQADLPASRCPAFSLSSHFL